MSRVRRVAGAATLAALVVTPVLLRAQHPTPAKASSFSELQAAVERIQKRVTTSVGAASVPQTAVTSLPKPPKPADPTAKTPPATNKSAADKPADKPAAAKPATVQKAVTANKSAPAALKERRIELSWRSSLTWPAEIAPVPPTPSSSRVTLIWR